MFGNAKKNSDGFLPNISKNPYEIDGSHKHQNPEEPIDAIKDLEFWLSNKNYKQRDMNVKEAFKKTEQRMEHKSRIDAMLSGTTCVMTFFNHDMILCANAGDSRAILISEHEGNQGGGENGYYFT